MKGQWIGASDQRLIVANIDELTACYAGIAYVNELDNRIPCTAIRFQTQDKSESVRLFGVPVLVMDPTNNAAFSEWDAIKRYFPEARVPVKVDLAVHCANDSLNVSWSSDHGPAQAVVLKRSMADKPSELAACAKDWEAFKTKFANVENGCLVYRGQSDRWRLRTSFHRTGRADLLSYLHYHYPIVYRHINAKTKHLFDLSKPQENAAFFSLIQHHGFPTPILDWTFSPFVAAFFAYRGVSRERILKADPGDKVRIFVFGYSTWRADLPQLGTLASSWPHISTDEFLTIENDRAMPQQAVSMITNVDDIETYILGKQSNDKHYLYAIDLPALAWISHQFSGLDLAA
jgi:hypothetical protein